MLSAKENALRVIQFGEAEFVPRGLPSKGLCYFGCNHEGFEGGGHDVPVGSSWVDIWGTRWEKEHEGVMGFPRGNPLAEVSALRSYQWPDANDPRLCDVLYEKQQSMVPGDYFLSGVHRDTLWEKAYMLVGMENMMIYLHEEPNFAREVLHRIMDFQLGMAKHYLKLGVELVHLGDDLGTQLGPLLGPELVREFLYPEYQRLFDLYKAHEVLIDFHSCGCITGMVELFLELGVNILNPVQASANNLDELRAKTAGKLALAGGISTALLMEGPRSAIERDVRRRLWQLGRNGGYFCAPDQGMPFPPEHEAAFSEALATYGRYPLVAPDDAQ